MNHYERLKVNPDAPIEVIRAAYRALAAKHHPDRHTQPGSSHGDMVALNAAYEVLADPSARAVYDAELAEADAPPAFEDAGPASRLQSLWRSTMGFGHGDTRPPGQATAPEPDESRVDVQWQPPLPIAVTNPWMARKRLLPLIGVVGFVGLVAGVMWVRATLLQIEAEHTLSQHYGGQLHADVAAEGTKVSRRTAAVTMTDEELLAEPPSLSGQTNSATRANHVLDGSPLNLRQETHLVDPLASPPAAAHP